MGRMGSSQAKFNKFHLIDNITVIIYPDSEIYRLQNLCSYLVQRVKIALFSHVPNFARLAAPILSYLPLLPATCLLSNPTASRP
jgi:hypothetical protein